MIKLCYDVIIKRGAMFLRMDVKFLPRVLIHQNLGYTRMFKEGQDIGLYFDEQKMTTIVVHDENHFSMDSGVRKRRAQYHPETKEMGVW